VPYWVFRDFRRDLAPAIAILFNRCFANKSWPMVFKLSNVIPVPKCQRPKPDEFRPISLLPILSKIGEKIVLKKWLIPHVVSHMDKHQFAFIPGTGKGTTCALTLLNHRILSHLDKPGAMRVVLLDYSKAFDRVLHDGIIDALIRLRAPQEAIQWVYSYLVGRCQRVVSGNVMSEWTEVSSGVPQGSVLGPFLFAALIDSLKPQSPSVTYIKFADDVTPLIPIRSPQDDCSESELEHILSWSRTHSLSLNLKKCQTLDLCTKKGLQLKQLTSSDGTVLESVSSARILGVQFSTDMKWEGWARLEIC
jgi:hypothetical protein